MDDSPLLADQAASYLRLPHVTVQLTEEEARCVVSYMRLVNFAKGAALFREGDKHNAHHMLVLLEGDVSVDIGAPGAPESVAISVLGPGSVIGELSFVDGAPRSATCTALSPLTAAGLARVGLERLMAEQPLAAAKLLAVISHCIADRLRALTHQLQLYAYLNASLRQEVEALRRSAPPT